MKKPTLSTVKDGCAIMSDGHSVLIFGKNLWLFRADGSFVAKYKTIKNPYKAVFLSGNNVLVDGAGDGSYHYISLDNGTILWSSIQKGRRTRSSRRFAVSPDGNTVYDACYVNAQTLQIEKLVPHNQLHDYYRTNTGLRTTNDIFCDQEGNLCILQSHIVFDEIARATRSRKYGILSINTANDALQCAWKKCWESTDTISLSVCGCDGKHILFENFDVLNIETQESFSLLQDESFAIPEHFSFDWVYDYQRHLLTVSYVGAWLNVVIDCSAKKVVAQYPRSTDSIGFVGCLVNDSFWVGTPDGIVTKDFPN